MPANRASLLLCSQTVQSLYWTSSAVTCHDLALVNYGLKGASPHEVILSRNLRILGIKREQKCQGQTNANA